MCHAIDALRQHSSRVPGEISLSVRFPGHFCGATGGKECVEPARARCCLHASACTVTVPEPEMCTNQFIVCDDESRTFISCAGVLRRRADAEPRDASRMTGVDK